MFLSVAFVAGAVISFFTGSSWGTFAICIPIAVPMAYSFTGGQLGKMKKDIRMLSEYGRKQIRHCLMHFFLVLISIITSL